LRPDSTLDGGIMQRERIIALGSKVVDSSSHCQVAGERWLMKMIAVA
jgi:hypothetical protein